MVASATAVVDDIITTEDIMGEVVTMEVDTIEGVVVAAVVACTTYCCVFVATNFSVPVVGMSLVVIRVEGVEVNIFEKVVPRLCKCYCCSWC